MEPNKSRIDKLHLFLTKRCNMECDYCFVKKKHSDMTFQIAKKSIDFLVQQKGSRKEIIFFGGEPLLRFDIIKEVLFYVRHIRRSLSIDFYFSLITNGTLLNKRIINFCILNKIDIYISLDGTQKNHDSHRICTSCSYKEILSKLDYLIRTNQKFYIMCTTHPEEAENLFKDIHSLFKGGCRNFVINPALGIDWKTEQVKSYLMTMSDLINFYNKTNKNKKILYLNLVDKYNRFQTNHLEIEHPCCEGRLLAVDTNGDIFYCPYKMEHKIGDVVSGILAKQYDNYVCKRAYACSNFFHFTCKNKGCLQGCTKNFNSYTELFKGIQKPLSISLRRNI